MAAAGFGVMNCNDSAPAKGRAQAKLKPSRRTISGERRIPGKSGDEFMNLGISRENESAPRSKPRLIPNSTNRVTAKEHESGMIRMETANSR
jgi:hypothetical protein